MALRRVGGMVNPAILRGARNGAGTGTLESHLRVGGWEHRHKILREVSASLARPEEPLHLSLHLLWPGGVLDLIPLCRDNHSPSISTATEQACRQTE